MSWQFFLQSGSANKKKEKLTVGTFTSVFKDVTKQMKVFAC